MELQISSETIHTNNHVTPGFFFLTHRAKLLPIGAVVPPPVGSRNLRPELAGETTQPEDMRNPDWELASFDMMTCFAKKHHQ